MSVSAFERPAISSDYTAATIGACVGMSVNGVANVATRKRFFRGPLSFIPVMTAFGLFGFYIRRAEESLDDLVTQQFYRRRGFIVKQDPFLPGTKNYEMIEKVELGKKE